MKATTRDHTQVCADVSGGGRNGSAQDASTAEDVRGDTGAPKTQQRAGGAAGGRESALAAIRLALVQGRIFVPMPEPGWLKRARDRSEQCQAMGYALGL